jgi:hypothetical protein
MNSVRLEIREELPRDPLFRRRIIIIDFVESRRQNKVLRKIFLLQEETFSDVPLVTEGFFDRGEFLLHRLHHPLAQET